MVLSQDGIFSRAEQATGKYGKAKARETLELCLSEAQMRKYESGLTEGELDEEISKVGSLIPKEDENSNYQLVIVEGHIFEVDRSVPKIVDYKGPADGIIITAKIAQNGDWQNPVATVTGTITKYGGGSVTSSTATATEGVTITGFPTTGGSYTIPNITKDTDITITASADDGKPAVTKTIKVRLVRDNTPPVISDAKAEATLMKIKISARAVDSESGIASLTYSVSPATIKTSEDGTTKATGTLNPNGTPIEIETIRPGNYTVTFTAEDKARNLVTTVRTVKVDTISIVELKKITAENYPDYLGTKVIDYNPIAGGTWRVFYYDTGDASHPNGYFGDGIGTKYLKRDYDSNKTMTLESYVNETPTTDAINMMKQMNPAWRDTTANSREVDLDNEKAVAGLCDTAKWTSYCDTTVAEYAIGAASIEMWTKAQNVYKNKYDTDISTIGCGIQNENGYGFTINGGSLSPWYEIPVVTTSKEQSEVIATESFQWLASPSSYHNSGTLCHICSSYIGLATFDKPQGVCPVVCIKNN